MPQNQSIPLLGLLVGSVRPLGKKAPPSGIAKSPVGFPVLLRCNGLAGDAQGDTLRHGGPEKAVHHYPFDHYVKWTSEIGPDVLLGQPGAFGENLSTSGLTEADVAIGDIFRLGRALIQVSQGRQPCWKLNERFADIRMARRVQESGRTGWYYRVLEDGLVAPDDLLTLVERGHEDWTIRRVWHHFYVDTMNADALRQIAELPALAQGWRNHAAKRLAAKAVEDWSSRLDSPSSMNEIP
ncbi:MOSC domain-containing protein [Microvirga rosea]|uniref:MOSC domain-containing protein n=1 Tax=Microvirga rosea TaxID=2715425 RepID=UPI001D0A20A5|nr:MOSC domain-containing protein [Microvirga rosea]MCB8819410.1 MOSC domain-containing protein [Microvirga rosea]